ncbi:MAG: hypothetical protein RJA81_330 [Planctomycetota bacterium]
MIPILASISLYLIGSAPVEADQLKIMSFNIRYGTAKDGPNSWDQRKELVTQTIQTFSPDILGTQETLNFQKNDLKQALPEYECLAVGRDDGREAGEMMAVFFRRDRFIKLDHGHFWLSESPELPGSKSWDSSLPRMVTWVKLRDQANAMATPVLFMNTHFDHRGETARRESARLIRNKAAELGKNCNIVITGDFNASPQSVPYQTLFKPLAGHMDLVDTYRAKYPKNQESEGTFSGFQPENTKGPRIDWIACSKAIQVIDAGIDHTSQNGRTASDHFPVYAVLSQKTSNRQPASLRVMSYNIHHGEGMDGKIDLDRIAKLVTENRVDLLALQEVDRKTKRAGGVDQTARLAELTGMFSTFGKAIDYSGGEYGQAILSKFPIENSKVHWLPGEPDRERRIAFEAQIEFHNTKMKFITTHLHHNNESFRIQQAEEINRIYSNPGMPVILAGDLNAMPESKPISILKTHWSVAESKTLQFSFPAGKPVRLIDFVLLYPKSVFQIQNVDVVDEPVASDHRPVIVDLQFADDQTND